MGTWQDRLAWLTALVATLSMQPASSADRTDPFGTQKLRPPAASSFWKGPASACSPTPTVPDPLRLQDAVDLALCNNPQTRESWANAKATAAALGIAQSAYLPTIDGSVSLQRDEVRNAPGSAGETSLNTALSLNYLLFDFGGRDANTELARESLLAANWAHNNTLQLVLLNAVQAYYQLFAAQEAVQSASSSERASLTSFEATRARLRVGNATRADVLQAQTALLASAAQSHAKRRRCRQRARNIWRMRSVCPPTANCISRSRRIFRRSKWASAR